MGFRMEHQLVVDIVVEVVFVELVTIAMNLVIRLAIVLKEAKFATIVIKLVIFPGTVLNLQKARLATAVERLDISPENVLSKKEEPLPPEVLDLIATNAAKLATLPATVP